MSVSVIDDNTEAPFAPDAPTVTTVSTTAAARTGHTNAGAAARVNGSAAGSANAGSVYADDHPGNSAARVGR